MISGTLPTLLHLDEIVTTRDVPSEHASSSATFDDEAREESNQHLESASTRERLEWAWETFEGEIVATSSFQTQSVPLLHMISETVPELPVVFLDTGFHFPETLAFRDRLEDAFGLDVRSETNRLGHEAFLQRYGRLYRDDPDLCCHLNKVEPLQRVLDDVDAWISGVRRDQTDSRSDTPVFGLKREGLYKVCPMVEWTGKDVDVYIQEHDLPRHPLSDEGYESIGCAPCTECPSSEENERSGRWADEDKEECGLHTDWSDQPDDIDSIELDDHDDT